jgi:hypothetical protein
LLKLPKCEDQEVKPLHFIPRPDCAKYPDIFCFSGAREVVLLASLFLLIVPEEKRATCA